MKPNEFSLWLDYHCERFPTLRGCINQHKETRRVWIDLFKGVTLDEARAVTDQMASGEIDRPHNLDWDRLPAMIVSEVKATRQFNSILKQREEQQKDTIGYKGAWKHVTEKDAGMAAAYREYLRLKEKGHEHADCCCAVRSMLGVATQEQAERYEAIR